MKKITLKMNMLKKLAGEHRGYALLFAVLVSAVVLGVGVSILNIARKEILLTSGAEQSQYAFYAADSGYECAVYQDRVLNAFASTSTVPGVISVSCGATYSTATPPVPTIYPSPVVVTNSSSGLNTNEYDYVFYVPVSAAGSCAAVTLQKFVTTTSSPDGSGGTIVTTSASTSITSDGFNVGWEASPGDCNASNPTKVERALLANY